VSATDTDLSADRSGPFASAWRRQHLTAEERVARGRTARKDVPRSSHGRWEYDTFAAAVESGRVVARTGV